MLLPPVRPAPPPAPAAPVVVKIGVPYLEERRSEKPCRKAARPAAPQAPPKRRTRLAGTTHP